jgi:type I restriction enzyme R subunit
VFSPPANGDADVRQLQEDLLQERQDNQEEPEKKKEALKAIIANYNAQYGTNHSIGEFDLYYQDVQKRIKDQQYPNADMPRKGEEKIDITIVVDMLLTSLDDLIAAQSDKIEALKTHKRGLMQQLFPAPSEAES